MHEHHPAVSSFFSSSLSLTPTAFLGPYQIVAAASLYPSDFGASANHWDLAVGGQSVAIQYNSSVLNSPSTKFLMFSFWWYFGEKCKLNYMFIIGDVVKGGLALDDIILEILETPLLSSTTSSLTELSAKTYN